eukprot:m.492047 g.492047  ORF g.492047 m.492047 type:complete len:345 (+) comp31428_c0_seq1:70-1104(+)
MAAAWLFGRDDADGHSDGLGGGGELVQHRKRFRPGNSGTGSAVFGGSGGQRPGQAGSAGAAGDDGCDDGFDDDRDDDAHDGGFYGRGVLLVDGAEARMAADLLALVESSDVNGVAWLLAAGADANCRNAEGWSPLHVAASDGNVAMIQALLPNCDDGCGDSHGDDFPGRLKRTRGQADINGRDSEGWTPLAVAVIEHRYDAALELLNPRHSPRADPNLHDAVGLTPLHYACMQGLEDMVQVLLQRGASVNALDDLHRPALYLAARDGHQAIVAALLGAGARPDLRSKAGVCAADVAATNSIRLMIEKQQTLQQQAPLDVVESGTDERDGDDISELEEAPWCPMS